MTAACLALASCASGPEYVEPAPVSVTTYEPYDCSEIQAEMQRVNLRVAEVSDLQHDDVTRDVAVTGVGLILFWPALFALAAGDHSDELARLKGELHALEVNAIQKKCDFADEVIAAREARQKEAERMAAERREREGQRYE